MPTVVEFPLRGEWIAPNTPGSRIPSHGTDAFGARYAYDFVGVAPNSRRFYRVHPLYYLMRGVHLADCYGWGRSVYTAAAGVVVHAEDGLPERDPVHLWRDVALMRQNARRLHARQPLDYHALAGNFVMTAGPEGYLVYAHLQTGSVAVAVGQPVAVGQVLGRVGNSGNSTAPHLHFQLMDDPDPWQGQGILCAFRAYDVYEAGEWRRVERGIPTASDRIRA